MVGLGGAMGVAEAARGRREPEPQERSSGAGVPDPSRGWQRIAWSVDTDDPAVALTFDDGPDPRFTPRVLDLLERYGIKATFMAMGYNAVGHPTLLKEVVAAGHEVGGHGWVHLNLAEATVPQLRREVEHAIARIEDIAQVNVRTYRPPYGRFSEDAVKLLGHNDRDLIIWSLTRGDLSWRSPAKIERHVVGRAGAGDIILMHDGLGRATFAPDSPEAEVLHERRSIEIEALPKILEGVQDRGLRFATVSRLMRKMRSPGEHA